MTAIGKLRERLTDQYKGLLDQGLDLIRNAADAQRQELKERYAAAVQRERLIA